MNTRETFPGLTNEAALSLLELHGPNELPSGEKRNFFLILLGILRQPIFFLLVAGAGIYLLMGSVEDALPLLASVFIVVGIGLYQELRSERALDALKELSSPRALVIRGSQERRIPGREVVPGDILVLNEGDRVPADGIVLSSMGLHVDESLLTGESMPVRKSAKEKDSIFSSTLVVKGSAIAQVVTTGVRTKIGAIGKSLDTNLPEQTKLQVEVNRLVKVFGVFAICFCVLVTVTLGLKWGDWPQGILAGIASAMSLLPEEFAVILTVFLAIGAWKISKKNVLTRTGSAIENLGAITSLCVDKTGTITQNKMSVKELRIDDAVCDLKKADRQSAIPELFHTLLEYSVLASQKDPFDPMEKAFHQLLLQRLAGTEHIHTDWELIREYSLSDSLLAMSCVWRSKKNQGAFVIAAKGAPEAIVDLCHLSKEASQKILKSTQTMASQGIRVLAVARAVFTEPRLPENQHDFEFSFIGLVGLEDPIREDAPSAVARCREAGVRILMLTGDYPETALHIATEIGLDAANGVLTGKMIDEMNDLELAGQIERVQIYSRMRPEQKLRIINALKANNEVVAMTGDGVNDAPSLKWADVGIAMGMRGTDVAREASDIVLVDDNLGSIVEAIEMGRKIYENIKKAMSYVLAVHVPIAGMALVPILFDMPLLFFPVHIMFLEIIIDPSSTLIFEAEPSDPNIMKRPPRKLNSSLVNYSDIAWNSLTGLISFCLVFAIYWFLLKRGDSPELARTVTYLALVYCNLILIIYWLPAGRLKGMVKGLMKNKALLGVLGVIGLFSLFVLFVPGFQKIFHFGGIAWFHGGLLLLLAVLMTFFILVVERLRLAFVN